MLKALLIYAAAIVAFIVAGTLATGTPLEQVAWLVLLVEVVPLATWGAAMSIRRMTHPKRRDDWAHLGCDPVAPPLPAPAPMSHPKRRDDWAHLGCDPVAPPLPAPAPMSRPKRRDDWTHLGCDPVAPPLPAPAPRVRIEAPQPKLLEAPGREVTKWHNGTE